MKTIKSVNDPDNILAVAKLANEIWNDHFVDIIGQQQVDYMLDQFQSPLAIASQIESGYEYYLVFIDGRQAGYLGLVPDQQAGKMMISKFYIRRKVRGRGLGNYLLDFVKQKCGERDLGSIWLTVNRFNNETINWYRRKGFVVIDEIKKDIGEGFYMDDFIMKVRYSKGR